MGRCRVYLSSASWMLIRLLSETQALEGLKKLHCPELQCSQQSQMKFWVILEGTLRYAEATAQDSKVPTPGLSPLFLTLVF